MSLFIRAVCLSVVFLSSAVLKAEIKIMPRQMVIFEGGVEELNGTLFWGVINSDQTAQKFRGELWLPKETADFSVVQGASPENVFIDENKKIVIEADFPPGQSMVLVTFNVKIRQGSGELRFEVPSMPPDQVLFIWPEEEHLAISSIDLEGTTPPKMGSKALMALSNKNPLVPGSTIILDIRGVTQGRYNYWVLGGIFAAILLGLSLLLTFRGVKAKSLAGATK